MQKGPENYLLIIDYPQLRPAIKVLKTLSKRSDIIVEAMILSIKLVKKDYSTHGLLGGIKKMIQAQGSCSLFRGYLPIPRKPQYHYDYY